MKVCINGFANIGRLVLRAAYLMVSSLSILCATIISWRLPAGVANKAMQKSSL